MSEVKRYECYKNSWNDDPEGSWVRHSDHLAAIKKLRLSLCGIHGTLLVAHRVMDLSMRHVVMKECEEHIHGLKKIRIDFDASHTLGGGR